MAAVIKSLEQVNADLQEQKERVENVDFKMVTFSLAGKDYGVDIMNVKEIAKADKFTYVPNAASFVRGVYNLRGDIIPIIDLRMFFQLPVDRRNETQENMLIVRVNDQVYGTIVDKIDKVIGVSNESIQPPHPIFGDINIKYIHGVVEKSGELFIILDVLRIFSISDDDKGKGKGRGTVSDSGDFYVPPPSEEGQPYQAVGNTDIDFIQESLIALKRFNVTKINEKWLNKRFQEWKVGRTGELLQIKTAAEANEFLDSFYSPFSDTFWHETYAAAVSKALPEVTSGGTINVWNIGCGKGYETYSFACILRNKYPDARIKIWANDNDIMAVSQAPNLIFESNNLPGYCRQYLVNGKNGYSFDRVIKDSIVFEYHDVTHGNTLPDLDFVLARDVLSFLSEKEQARVVECMTEKLKDRGVVFLGKNEEFQDIVWTAIGDDPVSAFVYTE